MRRSPSSSEHAEALSRRLATLSAELAAVRGEQHAADPSGPADPSDPAVEVPLHTRVRDRDGAPSGPAPPAAVPPPVVLPVPGRHASRRLRPGGAGPRGLALGPRHLAVVGLLAALALGWAAWTSLGGRAEVVPLTSAPPGAATDAASPEPLAPVAGTPASDAAPSSATEVPGTTPGTASGAAAGLVVDVAGKVRRPGIVVLAAGARVVDAIEAAGGVRPGVELTSLNLARPVVDGEQILVGVRPEPGLAGTLDATVSAGGVLVNLNTADEAALDTLPGVGPVTAGAILAWRDAHGGFTAVEELLEVDGIGPATLDELAPLVTL